MPHSRGVRGPFAPLPREAREGSPRSQVQRRRPRHTAPVRVAPVLAEQAVWSPESRGQAVSPVPASSALPPLNPPARPMLPEDGPSLRGAPGARGRAFFLIGPCLCAGGDKSHSRPSAPARRPVPRPLRLTPWPGQIKGPAQAHAILFVWNQYSARFIWPTRQEVLIPPASIILMNAHNAQGVRGR